MTGGGASRYHRPLYAAAVVRLLLVAGVAGAFTAVPLHAGAPVWAVAVTAAAGVATLPLDLWRGLFRERRFGLSRQTLRGWLADRAKGEAV
ncbi:MAG TPA: hypothetical protein VKR23_13045, partial [Gaiellaceae bacterium]|nr:hypothetical protein [Gaiellaceae bacterium]